MATPPEKRANSSKRERRLERGIIQTHSMECEFIIRRLRSSNWPRENIANSLFMGSSPGLLKRKTSPQPTESLPFRRRGARRVPPKHLSLHRNRRFRRRSVESRGVREGVFSVKIGDSGPGDAGKPGEFRLRGSSPIIQRKVWHDSSRAVKKLGSECLYLYPKHGRWQVTS